MNTEIQAQHDLEQQRNGLENIHEEQLRRIQELQELQLQQQQHQHHQEQQHHEQHHEQHHQEHQHHEQHQHHQHHQQHHHEESQLLHHHQQILHLQHLQQQHQQRQLYQSSIHMENQGLTQQQHQQQQQGVIGSSPQGMSHVHSYQIQQQQDSPSSPTSPSSLQGGSSSNQKRVQTRRSWTPEEDKQLIHLVNTGGQYWSQIATHLEGRVGKQCRERWRNHLDPSIRRDSFTPEEDAQILALVQELGTKWSKISQRMAGRTENAVKNRYHCFLKHHDGSGLKRTREDKDGELLHKHKRMGMEHVPFMADGISSGNSNTDGSGVVGGGGGGIGFSNDGVCLSDQKSQQGPYSCSLLGCGKQYPQLCHLFAHRLTHFSEGRHPSSDMSPIPVPIPVNVSSIISDPNLHLTDEHHQHMHLQHHEQMQLIHHQQEQEEQMQQQQQQQQHHHQQHHQHHVGRDLDGLVEDLLNHMNPKSKSESNDQDQDQDQDQQQIIKSEQDDDKNQLKDDQIHQNHHDHHDHHDHHEHEHQIHQIHHHHHHSEVLLSHDN